MHHTFKYLNTYSSFENDKHVHNYKQSVVHTEIKTKFTEELMKNVLNKVKFNKIYLLQVFRPDCVFSDMGRLFLGRVRVPSGCHRHRAVKALVEPKPFSLP